MLPAPARDMRQNTVIRRPQPRVRSAMHVIPWYSGRRLRRSRRRLRALPHRITAARYAPVTSTGRNTWWIHKNPAVIRDSKRKRRHLVCASRMIKNDMPNRAAVSKNSQSVLSAFKRTPSIPVIYTCPTPTSTEAITVMARIINKIHSRLFIPPPVRYCS